jgi:hypothetical protein
VGAGDERRVSTIDWKARAEREAASLLDAASGGMIPSRRDTLLDLLACAWMQGAILGSHESLAGLEVSFEQMQARL